MSHRFSNPEKVRQEILQKAAPRSWEDIPQEIRVLILEHIEECVQEILSAN